MNRLITYILTAMLAVHATLGCCWHHAHACDTGCCDAPAPTAAACGCHVHDGGHAHDGGNTQDNNGKEETVAVHSSDDGLQLRQPGHGSHRCDGETCNLTLTRPSASTRLQKAQGPLAVLAAPTPYSAIVARSARGDADFSRRLTSRGPRLHLLLAVLLI